MTRKRYCVEFATPNSDGSTEGFSTLNLYAVKMAKAYNVAGYGDALLLGDNYKLYSVKDNYFTTVYDTVFDSEPQITQVSYLGKPYLAAFTQNKNVLIGDDTVEFSAPLCDAYCYYDNRLFGGKERVVYYSRKFDITAFDGDTFVLPPNFGNVVKLCRSDDSVIIGCERGAWKLTVTGGEYKVTPFTADILSSTLANREDGVVYASNGGVCYARGDKIKKVDFTEDLTPNGTLGYFDGKCYVGCVRSDGVDCIFIYDFFTGKTSYAKAKVTSLGGKVGVTASGIVTFDGSSPEKQTKAQYSRKNLDFGSGVMKKVCAVIYKGDGEYTLKISSENGEKTVSGVGYKITYARLDGRSFSIDLIGKPNADGLEIFYYETGGGL